MGPYFIFVGLLFVAAAIADFHNQHCKNQEKIIDFLQNGIKNVNIVIDDKVGALAKSKNQTPDGEN